MRQPADRPAGPATRGSAGRRSSRSAAKNSTTGSTMTSEPMIQRTPWARPAPTGPMPLLHVGRAQHDRQAQHGQADAVPAVLGGQRFGLLRAGDRAGQAAGAAGEQVPARRLTTPEEAGRLFFLAAGRRLAVDRFAGGRFLLAAVEPERPREDAGRRVDVVRAGMCRTVIAFGARIRAGRTLVSRTVVRGPNVTDMTSVSPTAAGRPRSPPSSSSARPPGSARSSSTATTSGGRSHGPARAAGR